MKVETARREADDLDLRANREARRILRRLCEKNAFLVVAPDMEKAAVFREAVPGSHHRIAVVDRTIARVFALREWIACEQNGRVARYVITQVGRSALKRLLEEDRAKKGGPTMVASPFQEQHRESEDREMPSPQGGQPRRVRYNLAESPLTVLARKRSNTGEPYLSPGMLQAGERLREDFEISQIGPKVGQNWDRFLTTRDTSAAQPGGGGISDGAMAARERVSDALSAMGPGLSDIAFRVCCFLEGLETAEKRMGWSARSGKVVLRIALDRLARHYGFVGATKPAAELEERRRSA